MKPSRTELIYARTMFVLQPCVFSRGAGGRRRERILRMQRLYGLAAEEEEEEVAPAPFELDTP